jgi:hypothetical protein
MFHSKSLNFTLNHHQTCTFIWSNIKSPSKELLLHKQLFLTFHIIDIVAIQRTWKLSLYFKCRTWRPLNWWACRVHPYEEHSSLLANWGYCTTPYESVHIFNDNFIFLPPCWFVFLFLWMIFNYFFYKFVWYFCKFIDFLKKYYWWGTPANPQSVMKRGGMIFSTHHY